VGVGINSLLNSICPLLNQAKLVEKQDNKTIMGGKGDLDLLDSVYLSTLFLCAEIKK